MPGQPVDLGPFVGGLNNRTDDSTIDDTDLVEAVNWMMGIDGTLVGRPPVWEVPDMPGGTDKRLRILGWTRLHAGGVFTNVLLASNADGTWRYVAGEWDKISSVEFKDFTTYGKTNNFVLFPASAAGSDGAFWQYPDGSVTTRTNVPEGWTTCVHKDRIWIAGDLNDPNKLWWSMIEPTGANSDWDDTDPVNPSGFVDVNPGEGQRINYIMSYEDNLVIFKDDSTYVLAFDALLSQGQLQAVSNTVGATSPDCVTIHEGICYVYHEGDVYGFSQGQFQPLTQRFLPQGDSSAATAYSDPITLSVFADNLILRQYDKVYVHHMLTGAWTEWQSEFPISKFHLEPTNVGQEQDHYWITCADLETIEMYRINSYWDDVHQEQMECHVVTKTYDFGTARNFKRLFWWGIDCEAGDGLVSAWVTPFNINFIIRWDDVALGEDAWNEYNDGRTWNTLLAVQPFVMSPPVAQSSTKRRFYKCLKGLRFHQVNFKVVISTDGRASTGTVKLFAIVPLVDIKEGVVDVIT